MAYIIQKIYRARSASHNQLKKRLWKKANMRAIYATMAQNIAEILDILAVLKLTATAITQNARKLHTEKREK